LLASETSQIRVCSLMRRSLIGSVAARVAAHRVGSFRLTDPTRPGHRKILVFFLEDPHTGSSDVPLQQPWSDSSTMNLDQAKEYPDASTEPAYDEPCGR
jgi:hypothetical protein